MNSSPSVQSRGWLSHLATNPHNRSTYELDPEWSSLIRRALEDRPDPWTRVHQQAESELVERTLAFADYALAEPDKGSKGGNLGPRRDGVVK